LTPAARALHGVFLLSSGDDKIPHYEITPVRRTGVFFREKKSNSVSQNQYYNYLI
jgi:hypothetical protein